jgi:hypothetical protein
VPRRIPGSKAAPEPEESMASTVLTQRSPFRDFIGPGRRRTDHPVVVGTIVLCLGVSALMSILGVVGLYSLNANLMTARRISESREAESVRMRTHYVKALESQRAALLNVCKNTARTKAEIEACFEEPSSRMPIVPKGIPPAEGK